MKVSITKHFDYLTPFSEAANDEELAKIARLKYPKACSKLEVDAGFFARTVRDIREFAAWRVLGFASFENFCRDELGKTLDEVSLIIEGVRVLQARGVSRPTLAEAVAAAEEAGPLAKHGEIGGGHSRGDNVTSDDRGNASSYLSRRLLRDAPAVFDALKAGEYRSVRAAAIAAGIVRVPSNLAIALRAYARLTPEEKAQFKTQCEENQTR